ncbi:hypothetical protein Poli38472_009942 [Pythium oligandrum]|uniref:Uncharacterized protein n=1 Tax=Pythium oligandrum TaxID=41045 RepID=A0A8K1C8J0_PYTOL|nr:hypothetical protein Poli38472_009942 [Pythium oligandrum]|eukprot:TMW58383.1 hypothetical protein Poli38472_009942 [Pythium oligandrum]
MKWSAILVVCLAAALDSVHADDFPKLDEALPRNIDIRGITPLIDTDTDSCLPSAMISRTGQQNGGLAPAWASLVKGCRNNDFLNLSNTYHRYACKNSDGRQYCAHLFAYYFLKDQSVNLIPSGHKNDLEQVAVWTIDGRISHGSFSAHVKLQTKPADQLDKQDGHLKFVYHKDGGLTHCFRFAKPNEVAENPAGAWVLPTLVSWYTMQGDGIDNAGLRDKFNNYDYGTASLQIKDSGFRWNINTFRPSEFPEFSDDDVSNSQ